MINKIQNIYIKICLSILKVVDPYSRFAAYTPLRGYKNQLVDLINMIIYSILSILLILLLMVYPGINLGYYYLLILILLGKNILNG